MSTPVTFGSTLHRRDLADTVLTEASYPAGSRVPPHAHDHASLLWVRSGHMTERVGQRDFPCSVTGVMWKPAGVSHANRVSSATRVLVLELLPTFLRRLEGSWAHAAPGPELVSGVTAAAFAALLPFFQEPGDPSAAEELIVSMLGGVRRRSIPSDGACPAWLGRVRDRLHDDPRSRESLTELAHDSGVHPVHLARAFRARFGESITEYRHRRRIDLAVGALARTDEEIGRLALRLGYYDHAHFSRVFLRLTGLQPSTYRDTARPVDRH